MKAVRLTLILALCAAAGSASAQDLLGSLARQAAGAVASEVINRAVAGAVRERETPPEGSTPPRRRTPEPIAPEAEGLEGLSEEERDAECSRRVPEDADGGRSYEKQLAYVRCMGPRYGDGG